MGILIINKAKTMGGKPGPPGADEPPKYFYMKVVGGEVTPPAALAPKCGPLGIPPKKVGEDIQKATTKWKGIKIHIRAKVLNRVVTIEFVPTAAPLVIEALKEKPRDRKKEKNVSHNGNIKLDDVIRIAKTMRESDRSMAIEFKGTVKEILGTCVSLACTIDGKSAKEMTGLVESGEVKV